MKKLILAIALFLLIAGCVQITPKSAQAPDTNQDSTPQEPELPPSTETGSQDQNQPQQNTDTNQPQQTTPEPIASEPEILPEPTPQPLPLPPTARPAWVDLIANAKPVSLNEGKFIEINGAQNYSGTKFKVFLESIASTGGEFVARFRLETTEGEEVDKKTFTAGDDVSFEDENGTAIPFDGALTINGIYVG